ncbi:MAG: hypothetical protein AAF125_15475, partial [Chloroflexota bacterium]
MSTDSPPPSTRERINSLLVTLTGTESESGVAQEMEMFQYPTVIVNRLHLIILRLGLVASAVMCWRTATDITDFGDTMQHPFSLGLMFALNVIGFSLLLAAAYRRLGRRATYLIPAALVLIFIAHGQLKYVAEFREGGISRSDVWLFSEYGSQLLLNGQNPYEHDLTYSLWLHRSPPTFITPRLDGDIVSTFSYPALTIWLFLPFQLLRIPTIFVFPLFAFATSIAMYFAAPKI